MAKYSVYYEILPLLHQVGLSQLSSIRRIRGTRLDRGLRPPAGFEERQPI